MAQHSLFWATGVAGDGSSTYTEAQLQAWIHRVFGEGVHPNEGNELAVSGAATPLTIATGSAVVRGIPYVNDASTTLAVPTPAVGITGHRVVLRADYAANTVRLVLISSADGVSAAPSLTQTAGTTWEISLASLTITTGGAITVSDTRSYAHYNTAVNADMLDAAIVDASTIEIASNMLRVKDEGITAAKIANRTRTMIVPALYGLNSTTVEWISGTLFGLQMPATDSVTGYGNFLCPSDFASTMTIQPIILPSATGNVRLSADYTYGAVGEIYNQHSNAQAEATLAVTVDVRAGFTATALSSIAAGDFVLCTCVRDGADVLDTMADDVFLVGWLVSYTADS